MVGHVRVGCVALALRRFGSVGRGGYTLKELFAVVAVVAILCAIASPLIQAAREESRRNRCVDNLKILGVALHNHHDDQGYFPPSSDLPLEGAVPGNADTAGWSWRTRLLPFAGHSLSFELDHDMTPVDPHYALAKIQIPLHSCPSAGGGPYAGASEYTRAGGEFAVSNYVALGASTRQRLYGDAPDGVMFPQSRVRFRDMVDGSSNTLAVCETRETDYAAWVDGTVAAVFAVTRVTDGVADPASITEKDFVIQQPGSFLNVDESRGIRTTVAIGRKLQSVYDENAFAAPWRFGPSSHHKGVVNHLFADGSVRGVMEDVDVNLYLHLVTYAGKDPVGEFL